MSDKPSRVTSRYYLSRHHRKARDSLLAKMHELNGDSQNINEISACCVALVTCAVSYMECRINEFYSGILNFGRDDWSLEKQKKQSFQNIVSSFDWKRQITILEKYQVALAILGLERFNTGNEPYQSAETLIKLRNELVHSEPHSMEMSLPTNERSSVPALEKRLRSKIGECPYKGLKEYFPENCLHLKCGEWAASSSQKFVDEFLSRAGASLKIFVGSFQTE